MLERVKIGPRRLMADMFVLFNRVVENSSGCHIWKGASNKLGYGVVRYRGKRWATHRLAWKLANNKNPGKMFVLHSCDNPRCVNPKHLSIGTQLDNVRDCISKGRRPVNRVIGSSNARTKLTPSLVKLIRKSKESRRKLGKEIGVDQATIRAVVYRRTWRHVV